MHHAARPSGRSLRVGGSTPSVAMPSVRSIIRRIVGGLFTLLTICTRRGNRRRCRACRYRKGDTRRSMALTTFLCLAAQIRAEITFPGGGSTGLVSSRRRTGHLSTTFQSGLATPALPSSCFVARRERRNAPHRDPRRPSADGEDALQSLNSGSRRRTRDEPLDRMPRRGLEVPSRRRHE